MVARLFSFYQLGLPLEFFKINWSTFCLNNKTDLEVKRTRTKESTALFLISTQKAMSKYEIVNKFICEFITIWQACNLESLIYQMKLCKQRNGRNLEIPYFPITGQKLWKFADVSGLSLSLSTIPFLQDVPNPPKKSDIIYGSIVLLMK